MANNYTQSSTLVRIPADKMTQAVQVAERIAQELEAEEDGSVGYRWEREDEGIWIYGEESIDVEHVERLMRALVEELDLPGTFLCSWAYTCSRPRVDEFGGGALVVQKQRDTVWVDAASTAQRLAGAPAVPVPIP